MLLGEMCPSLLEANVKSRKWLHDPRYAREQMVSIWSPETKFRIWFEIEAHATDKPAELGVGADGSRPQNLGKRPRRQIRRGAHRRDRARSQASTSSPS